MSASEQPNVARETATTTANAASDAKLSAVERYKRAKEARRTAPPQRLGDVPAFDTDTLWRGLTREGEVRVLLVRATHSAAESTQKLGCSADTARMIAELMTGAQLLRACLNPDEQVQLSASNDGAAGNFVVDVWAEGHMRATVREPGATGEGLIGQGTAQIARILRGRGTYRSAIGLGGDDVETLLMRYLLESEQILSYIKLDVAVDDSGAVHHAHGFLIQLMPEGTREHLARIVANLEDLPSGVGMSADDPDGMAWASQLMNGLYWDQAARQDVGFLCPCSPERVVALLSTLPRADIEELAADGSPLETTCDYCRVTYTVPQSQVQALLEVPS